MHYGGIIRHLRCLAEFMVWHSKKSTFAGNCQPAAIELSGYPDMVAALPYHATAWKV